MKLFTLKELEETVSHNPGTINIRDLKEEVIKHYKLFEKKFIELCEGSIDGPLEVASYQGKMEFIKEFFNITDEELNTKKPPKAD